MSQQTSCKTLTGVHEMQLLHVHVCARPKVDG